MASLTIPKISTLLASTANQADQSIATGGNSSTAASDAVQSDADTISAGYDDWKMQNPNGTFSQYQSSVEQQTGTPDAYAAAAWNIVASQQGITTPSTGAASSSDSANSVQNVDTTLAQSDNDADEQISQGGNSATIGSATIQNDYDIIDNGYDSWKQSNPNGTAQDYEKEVKKTTGSASYADAAWGLFDESHQ